MQSERRHWMQQWMDNKTEPEKMLTGQCDGAGWDIRWDFRSERKSSGGGVWPEVHKKKKEKKEREVSQMWSEWTGGRGEGKREMVVSREILLSLKSLVGGAGGASTSRRLLKSSPFIIFCSYLGLGNRRTVNCLVPYSSRIYYYYY